MKNCIDLYTLTSGFEEVNAHFLVESSLFLLWWGLFRLPIPDVGVSTEQSLFSNCWYVIEISAIWRKQRAFLMLSVALHRHLLVFCYSVLQNPRDSVSTSVFSGNFSISAPFFFFFCPLWRAKTCFAFFIPVLWLRHTGTSTAHCDCAQNLHLLGLHFLIPTSSCCAGQCASLIASLDLADSVFC